MLRTGTLTALALCLTGCASVSTPFSIATESSTRDANAASSTGLHGQILTLDAHLDTPALFHRDGYNFSERGTFSEDGTNVDLPRLREGELDGGFWVIYTAPGPLNEEAYIAARNSAILRQASIRELAAKYEDSVELAFSADDAERIHNEGKIVVYQSMENAYPLGEDISLLETFYVGGMRMLGLVHFVSNQFADSSTSPALHEGLSPLGEELVREANRLGMIVDASHSSDDALRDMMAVSSTPVILSHSGPDGVFEHARNVPDELLLQVAELGGVVHVNAFGGYLEALESSPEREAAMEAVTAEHGGFFDERTDEEQMAFRAAMSAVNEQFPAPRSTFEKYLEHLFYTLDLVGPDHVGIGADWDGGGGVIGMDDVVDVPKITQALEEAGYSAEQIENIWSGNLLRVLREVEAARTADLESPNVLR